MSTEWLQCAICMGEQFQSGHTVRTIVGDQYPICSECVPEVLALFENALKNEINFPPRWGPIEIPFESFEDLFSDDFRLAYHEKTREFNTPVPKRVYCKHKVPAKGKSADEADFDFCNIFMGVETKVVSKCSGGTHWMCMECREIALPPPATHTCDATKADSEKDAFDANTRGIEWQECPNPNCKIKCDLKEGCNAMICPCQQNFCFICGEVAGHDSNHWMEGKPCPRWGAANAPNHIFDTPGQGEAAGFLINPWEGDVVVFNTQQFLDGLVNGNNQLNFDADESLTLLEELASEQHFMEDAEGNIPKVILDMMELLRLWEKNFSFLVENWVWSELDPLIRGVLVPRMDEAIGTTNFFIRDEILQAKLRETHAAALEISGEDSVLFEIPVMEIFERYNTVHKPRMIEDVRQFVAARDAGRTLWFEEEDRFARGMHRRQQHEDDQDLPHRRASI